jgi:hypothetical protein
VIADVRYVEIEGGGHLPHVRDPVFVNLAIAGRD